MLLQKVITTGSTKGGVGKSTVTVMLAAELSTRGFSTAVLDLDEPQSSAFSWISKSKRLSEIITVEKASDLRDSHEDIASAMERLSQKHDFLLTDVTGYVTDGLMTSVMNSDLVLIPACHTSSQDSDGIERCCAIVSAAERSCGRPIDHRVLINRARTRGDLQRLFMSYVDRMNFPVLESTIRDTSDVHRCSIKYTAPSLVGGGSKTGPRAGLLNDVRAVTTEVLHILNAPETKNV